LDERPRKDVHFKLRLYGALEEFDKSSGWNIVFGVGDGGQEEAPGK
jgi:hypothetical protein